MPTPHEKTKRYGPEHRKLRAHYQQRIDSGEVIPCWRCNEPIDQHTLWGGVDGVRRCPTTGTLLGQVRTA